ncbi:MAG TPA: cytochrome c [Stellaceae bacterium]|nr:cytochrome c [Stellaceae bacterium]
MAGAVGGIAQDKLAAVKARQDFMKGQGADVKAIVGFAKGNGTQPAALKAVDDLLARAPKINDQFPAGTSATDFPGKTHAKPEIWTDWDKVKMISTTVQSEEEKLKAAIQKGDKAAVSAQIGALNKNGCGACHGHYRLPYS